ncbi:bud emergence protein 1 [Mortierella claussenii]|nr:bud emergence protein 1 [Mortierella claussenii]
MAAEHTPSHGSSFQHQHQHYHHNPHRIIFASVESFHHEDDQYWFSVRVELASGAARNLYRLYEDFYNFHIALLEEFPVESGRVGDQPRILPFMPIPVSDVTDALSASRRRDLDAYVQDLCKLPPRIVQHPLVENLFAVRDGDTETPAPSPSTTSATLPATATVTSTAITSALLSSGEGIAAGRTSSGARSVSPVLGRSHASQELDRRPSPAMGTGVARPGMVSSRSYQGVRSYGDDANLIGQGGAAGAGMSPGLRSLPQFPAPPTIPVAPVLASAPLSSTGSTSTVGGGSIGGTTATSVSTSEEMIKVKIAYQGDIMAMRIPVLIGFEALRQKILDRLGTDLHRVLSYRDDGNFAIIQQDADVREAMDRSGGKLMIYVD